MGAYPGFDPANALFAYWRGFHNKVRRIGFAIARWSGQSQSLIPFPTDCAATAWESCTRKGHQTSQKEYKSAKTVTLDSLVISGILASHSQDRPGNPNYWLHSQVTHQQAVQHGKPLSVPHFIVFLLHNCNKFAIRYTA